MTVYGYQDRPPFAEEANIAWHLASGHGFKSPMDPSPMAPPTAWTAPIYPLVIAAAYRLFGIQSPLAVTFLMLVNALCFGAIAAGIQRLAALLFHSHAPGILAATLLAFHPLFLFYMGDFWDGFLSLAIFLWLTIGALQLGMAAELGGHPSQAGAAALGGGMGLLALTNASYCVTYPLLVLLAYPKSLSLSRWRLASLTLAVFLIVLSPWTIRNYQSFGQLIPIRTGMGVQFWLGNAPVSQGWLDEKAYALHPYVNPDERSSLLQVGEPAYDRLALERFRRGFFENPPRYFIACARRTMYLLLGEPTQFVAYPILAGIEWQGIVWDSLLLNVSVAILGLGGMLAARRLGYRQRGMPALIGCVVLPFIPSAVIDRYSLPLRCLLVMYAGALLWMVAYRTRGHITLRQTNERGQVWKISFWHCRGKACQRPACFWAI